MAGGALVAGNDTGIRDFQKCLGLTRKSLRGQTAYQEKKRKKMGNFGRGGALNGGWRVVGLQIRTKGRMQDYGRRLIQGEIEGTGLDQERGKSRHQGRGGRGRTGDAFRPLENNRGATKSMVWVRQGGKKGNGPDETGKRTERRTC